MRGCGGGGGGGGGGEVWGCVEGSVEWFSRCVRVGMRERL